jgi:hypothetical protein
MTKTITKPAEKIQISETELWDVRKGACLLTNVQLNVKVNGILVKIKDGTATDRERREAVILSQVILNRGGVGR